MSSDKYIPKCIEGTTHKGDYMIRLYKTDSMSETGEDRAVSWCTECGAVSVDRVIDGRFYGSISGLKFPHPSGLEKKVEASEAKQ